MSLHSLSVVCVCVVSRVCGMCLRVSGAGGTRREGGREGRKEGEEGEGERQLCPSLSRTPA
eukprot:3001143-Rhodomonas_salina.1